MQCFYLLHIIFIAEWQNNIIFVYNCIKLHLLYICRYVVFAIKDGKIDAETIGDLEKTYDEFLVDVKKETDAGKKDCRFAGEKQLCNNLCT